MDTHTHARTHARIQFSVACAGETVERDVSVKKLSADDFVIQTKLLPTARNLCTFREDTVWELKE